jgi:hypothetical protein
MELGNMKKRSDYVLARDVADNGNIGALDLEILSGLDLTVDSLLPPVIGASAAAVGQLLLRRYVANTTVQKWAPLLGGVLGAVASVPLKYWKGDSAMQAGMISALLVGGISQFLPQLETLMSVPPRMSGYRGLTLERLNGLTLERVGSLPMLPSGSFESLPASVRNTVDMAAYGRV